MPFLTDFHIQSGLGQLGPNYFVGRILLFVSVPSRQQPISIYFFIINLQPFSPPNKSHTKGMGEDEVFVAKIVGER